METTLDKQPLLTFDLNDDETYKFMEKGGASYKGYVYYFLKKPITVWLLHQMIAIKDNEDSIGLVHLHSEDMNVLVHVVEKTRASFPYRYPTKDMFKINVCGSILPLKIKGTKFFSSIDNKPIEAKDLPSSFVCHVAIEIMGMKVKNYQSSLIMNAHQVNVEDTNELAMEIDTC
jgi:hypothetical protein